jgi:hypothetical protein
MSKKNKNIKRSLNDFLEKGENSDNVESLALKRIQNFDRTKAISHEDMLQKFKVSPCWKSVKNKPSQDTPRKS